MRLESSLRWIPEALLDATDKLQRRTLLIIRNPVAAKPLEPLQICRDITTLATFYWL